MNSLIELERSYFGPAPRPRRRGAPVHPVRFRVDPSPRPLEHPSDTTAWAAAVAMLLGWKRGSAPSPSAALADLDGPFSRILSEGRGLTREEVTELLVVSGLGRRSIERPQRASAWHELLRQYGPLWALRPERPGDRSSLAGLLVVGLRGDGTPGGTRLLLLDPRRGTRRPVTLRRFVERMRGEGRSVDVIHLPANARQAAEPRDAEAEPSRDEVETPPTADARAESFGALVRAFEQPRLSEAGLDFIARHEGFRGTLYNDAGGHCTIGYGHLVHLGPCNGTEPEEFRSGITEARARQLLRADAATAESTVRAAVTPTLTQSELDALVSFTFNVGNQAFRGSTLLRELNAGHRGRVPTELARWNRSGGRVVQGLVRRRADEARLFTQGDYGAPGARGQSWAVAASIPPAVVGGVETVLDRDARLRSGPPGFAETGQRLPQYSQVTIRTVSGDYVEVTDAAGAVLGWTKRNNLGAFFKDDATLGTVSLAPNQTITIDPSWPRQKRRLGELYNRLGGLFERLAGATGTTVPAALAVWWVESGGRQHRAGRAIIRFENHLFFRRWGSSNVAQYDAHFQHGGHAGVGGRPWQNHRYRRSATGSFQQFHGNQTSEYDALDVARRLANDDIALQCISMGGPQILGSNHRTVGYGSPTDMYNAFQADERWHVLGFYDYCQYHYGHLARRRQLLDHLSAQRWVDFARGYNGSGQAQAYGGRIQAAHAVAASLPLP